MSAFKTALSKGDDELRRYSSEDLLGAYAEKLSVSAALAAHDAGAGNRDLVAVVADLRTRAGRQVVGQIATLAKGAFEEIHVSGIDPNEVSISDQESGDIWTALVPRSALETFAATLEKAELGHGRTGALVLAIGKDGWNFSQER